MNPGVVCQLGTLRLIQKIAQAQVSKKLIGTTGDGTKVILVEGGEIRDLIDVEYGLGAHSLCRPYVPDGEIWIERLPSVSDMEANLAHELVEYFLMKYTGMAYREAHARAQEVEKKYRVLSKTAALEKRAINFSGILRGAGNWLRGVPGAVGRGVFRVGRGVGRGLQAARRFFSPQARYSGIPTQPRATILPPPPPGITGAEPTMIDVLGRTHIGRGGTVAGFGGDRAGTAVVQHAFSAEPLTARPSSTTAARLAGLPSGSSGRVIHSDVHEALGRLMVPDPVPVSEHFLQARNLFAQVPLPPEWAPLAKAVGRPVAPTYNIAAVRRFPAQYYSLGGAGSKLRHPSK